MEIFIAIAFTIAFSILRRDVKRLEREVVELNDFVLAQADARAAARTLEG